MGELYKFRVKRMFFPSIYAADPNAPGGPTFNVSWDDAETPLDLHGMVWVAPNRLSRASSKYAPEVDEIDRQYERLAEAFKYLDVRNITRDRLFAGKPAELYVLPWEADTPNGHRKGLNLVKIVVAAGMMESVWPLPEMPA